MTKSTIHKNGEINISKITKELKTSRTTVMTVLNGG